MGLESFVINPSINVSPYCYSILRVEPYATCDHGCVYCFGRWYRAGVSEEGGDRVVSELRRILKFLETRGRRSIPFRLSTLVDPFQPREAEARVSRKIMLLCLKHEAPLIINTKSTLLLGDENVSVLRELSSRGLAIVQISLSTINPRIAGALEPRAPPPDSRLDAAERLSSEGIPVIIRLQPFIPGVTEYEAEEIIRRAHYSGVRQVIVEALRDEDINWRIYQEIAYEDSLYRDQSSWSSYSPSVEVPSKVLRPNVQWRRSTYLKMRDLCSRYNMEFSTCKEGFYDYHTARNCCGMHFMDEGKYALRPTLGEVWEFYRRRKRLPSFNELLGELSEAYIFGDRVRCYPRPLRRKIMQHEKILREVLDERREKMDSLLPALQNPWEELGSQQP